MREAFALAESRRGAPRGRIVACDTPASACRHRRPIRTCRASCWRRDADERAPRVHRVASRRVRRAARRAHRARASSPRAIAAAIGIPLGILAARRPAIARPLVGLANLAQTIPSLALFGFLIPLPFIGGIGTRTALVALTSTRCCRSCAAPSPAFRACAARSSSARWRWA